MMNQQLPLRDVNADDAHPDKPPALLNLAMIRRFYLPQRERTIHRWISNETFPRPDIRIGAKVRLWKRQSLEDWIAAQSEATERNSSAIVKRAV